MASDRRRERFPPLHPVRPLPWKEPVIKRLHDNLTYSNVMVTILALIVVGGGTAYATQVLPKESVGSKQIKKGAVTPAKLSKTAKKTLTGPQGPKGETGPRGERGEPGPAVQILPSGQTEVGVWATGAANGGFGMVQINFLPQLSQGIPSTHEKYLKPGETSTECPGTGKAAAGYLCVYAAWNIEMTFLNFVNPVFSSSEESSPAGVVIYFRSSEEEANTFGNWAYTAP